MTDTYTHTDTYRVDEIIPVWRADDNKLLGRRGKLVSELGCCLSELDYQGS